MSYWDELPIPWQAALEEAWIAYRHGSWPIGAVIVQADRIVARGRSRSAEPHILLGMISGNSLAHAEMNALMQIPGDLEGSDAMLYTTLEPCPMCAGAIRVSHLPTTFYAARDAWGGSSQMFQVHPYMTRENIRVLPAGMKTLEEICVALLLQSYLEQSAGLSQLAKFETMLPNAVRLARATFKDRLIAKLGQTKAATETVINELAARLELDNT